MLEVREAGDRRLELDGLTGVLHLAHHSGDHLVPLADCLGQPLRIAMFPATDPADVRALTACIDWVLERL